MMAMEASVKELNYQDIKHRCPNCDKVLRDVIVEVWPGYKCYMCGEEMEIIAMYIKGFEYISFIPPSIIPIAEDLGVKLIHTHSPNIKRTYPMQVCPNCERKQGEWYTTKDRDERLIEEYKRPIREKHFTWCEICDIWTEKEKGSQINDRPETLKHPAREERGLR